VSKHDELINAIDELDRKISHVLRLVKQLMKEEKIMALALEALQAAVEKNGEVEASAITLIQGIAQQLKDAQTDPAAIAALSDKLTAQADALAAAVVANTPAA
jgi:hypothetical protein